MSDDIVTRLRRDCMSLIADEAADQIERLREERDEIRLSYCLLMEAYRGGDGRVTANKLGWGYLFAEDSK
jgi:hypothetical protein